MGGWTRLVLRHRALVLGFWIAVFLAGGFGSVKLAPLLSNTFAVPGTDSERVRAALEQHFGDRPDGSFTVVFQLSAARTPAVLAELQRVVDRAATTVPTAKPTQLLTAGTNVVFGDIVSTWNIAQAKKFTDPLLRALGTPPARDRRGRGDPPSARPLHRGEHVARDPLGSLGRADRLRARHGLGARR